MIRLIVVASACVGLILLASFVATRLVNSRRRGMSIRLQVFIALASTVGAFAFGLGLMVIDRIEARAQRFAVLGATEQAQLLAHLLSSELDSHAISLAEVAQRLEMQGGRQPLLGVELFDASGRSLFRSRRGFPSSEAASARSEAEVLAGGRPVGRVQVTKTTIEMERLLSDFAPSILVISLVLGAAAALAAAWIGRAIGGPIEALSEFSERIAAGEPARAPPPAFHGREVARLSRSLDSMRRQLEGRPFVETFAADLSHELKNPVAAIRASAEVLDDSALEEPEEARRFVRRIREATLRIERLLSELLSLARIEAHGVQDAAPVELAEMTRLCVAALDTAGRVEITSSAPVHVRGEPHWLTRAVANLVDNALVHSEGAVRVEVERAGKTALVRVGNDGAISKHTRARMFGRFVTTRADKGGTGLGLAIVRAVAEAHRGRVQLTHAGPPRVEFELSLPAVERWDLR